MNIHFHVIFALSVILTGCSRPTVAKNGGYLLVYKQASGDRASPESMARALESRLRAGGFKHATVAADAAGIRVELPGVKAATAELANAKELIAHQGVIEFRILADRGVNDEVISAAEALPANAAAPADAAYKWARHDPAREIAAAGSAVTRAGQSGAQQVLVLVDPELTITGNSFASASAALDAQRQPCISATLNAEGGSKMSALTTNNLQRRLGIIFDDEVISAPVIQSGIGSSFQITGHFTQQEVDSMIAILKSGTLPGRLEPTPATEEYVAPK